MDDNELNNMIFNLTDEEAYELIVRIVKSRNHKHKSFDTMGEVDFNPTGMLNVFNVSIDERNEILAKR